MPICNRLIHCVASTLLLCASTAAYGDMLTFGIIGDSSSEAINVINNHPDYTAQLLASDLSNLGSFDIVWGLNNSNTAQPAWLSNSTNKTLISLFVSNGGGLIYSDGRVTGANAVLPGGNDFTFTRAGIYDLNRDPNLATDVLRGVSNEVTNTNLDQTDGGSIFASHGYATLKPGSSPDLTPILTTSNSSQMVDFQYSFGVGFVYYSAIPMADKLVNTPNPFASIYAPLATTELADSVIAAQAVPEPTSLAFVGVAGLGMALMVRRRRAGSAKAT
ncbi:hypothetical protein Poly51_08760 [Rubripirellula tenax]|uniref:Ice-binding protein C-terminal domain-containing protein n=1 Tax=Rubripirellula tenax TaxID=2528015 RepID=A0A5C6FGM4_9BACT|nr:PEP-CTERM sorting domain-containing protein [Rubripirellula tenax]TWU60598.1 hypothetical protein Poly51_08760 [Rubripirellula tenax]